MQLFMLREQYPSKTQMEALASRCNTTPMRIQIWFQNQRQRGADADPCWQSLVQYVRMIAQALWVADQPPPLSSQEEWAAQYGLLDIALASGRQLQLDHFQRFAIVLIERAFDTVPPPLHSQETSCLDALGVLHRQSAQKLKTSLFSGTSVKCLEHCPQLDALRKWILHMWARFLHRTGWVRYLDMEMTAALTDALHPVSIVPNTEMHDELGNRSGSEAVESYEPYEPPSSKESCGDSRLLNAANGSECARAVWLVDPPSLSDVGDPLTLDEVLDLWSEFANSGNPEGEPRGAPRSALCEEAAC